MKAAGLVAVLVLYFVGSSYELPSTIQLAPDEGDARERIENAENGTVVVLLPGTFTTLCDVQIRRNLYLHSSSGQRETILDCGEATPQFHIAGDITVQLKGISLVNGTGERGGCVGISNGARAVIAHCSFQDCHANVGGAISADISSVQVTHSSFRSTTAASGGAIFVNESTVTVREHSSFTDKAAKAGGVALVWQGNLEISDHVTIERCYAEDEGEAFRFDFSTASIRNNLTIRDCIATDGILEMYGSAVDVSDGVFAERLTTLRRAGFAYVRKYSAMSIRRHVIVHGVLAGKSGGCLFVDESTLSVSDNVHFSCSTESYAGGMYVEDSSAELRGNVTFDSCTLLKDGGTVLVETGAMRMQHVVFNNSWAPRLGGAVLLYEATMHMDHVTFVRSEAGEQGGDLYLEKEVYLDATRVWSRDARAGGAGALLFVKEESAARVEGVEVEGAVAWATGLSLYGPSEQGSGAALFVLDSSTVTVGNSTFRGCWAEGQGWVVFVESWRSKCHVTLESVHETNCSARDGGAVAMQRGKVTVTDVTAEGCVAERDGGMAYAEGGTLTMVGVKVGGCMAGCDSGAISAVAKIGEEAQITWVRVGNSTLDCNMARGGMGGGMAGAGESLRVVISDSSVTGNKAVVGAGVSVASRASMEIASSQLSNNVAGTDGGCAHVDGGAILSLHESQLGHCHAAGRGGGAAVGSDIGKCTPVVDDHP